jgi:two-component system chemotaxis response regulator CheB
MNPKAPLRVLVVDDTVVYRKIVSDVLSKIPGVEVVGTAHNGKAALVKIASLKPDLLTLDIEMPEMNGLEVLRHLQDKKMDVGAIMLSTLTQQGGAMTMRALELGAFDFIPKPQEGSMAENLIAVKASLSPMLQAYAKGRQFRKLLRGALSHSAKRLTPGGNLDKTTGTVVRRHSPAGFRRSKSEIIAIGISTGGPNALSQMLPRIPGDIGVPIVIVQHMPPVFTNSLAKSLDTKCKVTVKEACNGDPLQPNTAYIAPGGMHMKIMAGSDGKTRVIKTTQDPPENSCRPSADYLFRSVADHYVGRATAVIMTGMGTDGNEGLKQMKRSGALVIAQDKSTCIVFGMPKEPIESGTADVVASLDRIADEIIKSVRQP